jgi:hypothetical protein
VEKYFDLHLTGPVKHGVLFKANCFAQNPSAETRGGFLYLDCGQQKHRHPRCAIAHHGSRKSAPRVGAVAAHAGVAQLVGKSDVEVGLPNDNQGETAFSSRLSRDIGYWDGREL